MSPKKPLALVSVLTVPRKFTGRFLIRLDPRPNTAAIMRTAKNGGLRLVAAADPQAEGPLSRVLQEFDGILFERLRVALINEAGAAKLEALQRSSGSPFLSAEPERFVRKLQATSKGRGSGPYKDTSTATWGIHAVGALATRATGKGVKLAILDTGFDFTHPDFSGRTLHRKSFVGTRAAKDNEGHGTHIAGIAGGDRKGRDGARYGLASGARLYIGKILDDNGEGTDGQTLAGIEWALEKGCQIISMSFGAPMEAGEPCSAVFEQVAQIAMAHRCLLVAASGNESDRAKTRPVIAAVNHPANCPSIMAVGALTPALGVADYSCAGTPGNVGVPAASGDGRGNAGGQIDIAAPGDNILSAKPGGGYRRESGTSMATAFVAGLAALLWEQYPNAGAWEIWARLTTQAWRLGLSAADIGAGLCVLRN
ncbi:MAG TPA: S8 family serine peptidase [Puia sp.]|nr:S8 family serine peptidase [Puia sp.]